MSFSFLLQEETNPGSIAESKDNSFPFLIFMGALASQGKIYIAADKQIICSFEVSLVEAALALLATYCVFLLCIIILLDWQSFIPIFKNAYCTFLMAKSFPLP